MKIQFVAVGKIKERGLREAIDDYAKRIRHYAQFEEIELKDERETDLIARFERALPDRGRVVALEVDGKAWSSAALAKFVGQCESGNVQTVSWLIGGSYGLPTSISARAHVRLSLSAMTFPHRIARLVLAEQVYRAFTILRGEPYAH